MPNDTSYCVLLDANVWVTERLLQSSIGSALLYALTQATTHIVLPEVVELEVNSVLNDSAENAVASIARDTLLLRQLSGHRLIYTAPSSLAINEGIAHRWRQLDGILRRVTFSYEHARAALHRVISKNPPSGQNNEQFRDCCIWEVALEVASERNVHLVTNDLMFYEGRDRTRGLAAALRAELAASGRNITVYPNLRDFLTAMHKTAAVLDEADISSAIVAAVLPKAREIAAQSDNFEIGEPSRTLINGYATPRPSLVAVSFDVWFELSSVESQSGGEKRRDATLRVEGICSYDPNGRQISDIEIRQWTKSLKSSEGLTFMTGSWKNAEITSTEHPSSRTRLIT